MADLAKTPAHPALPRRGRGRRRRVFRLSLLIAAVIVLGLPAVAGALVLTAGGAMQRVAVGGLGKALEPGDEVAGVGRPPAADRATGQDDEEQHRGRDGTGTRPLDEPVTLLLVGTDSREGLSERQLRALGTEDHGAALTDGLMLVRLDPEETRVTVLSLPRDLLVQRCDGTRGRINQAYHIGEEDGEGPTCLVETVTALTGIRIDHYAQVNMAGFIDVLDLLGGISLYLEEPLRDPAAGLDLPEGCVELDGKQALAFVRARKSLGGGGDLDRIARQQRLLGEVVQQATDASTLANLPKLFTLASTAGRAVETDEDLSLNLLRRLALSFRDAGEQDVAAFTVPAEEEVRGGAYYLTPTEEADEVFEGFADGSLGVGEPAPATTINGAGSTAERSDRPSGDAANGRVERDATGTPGVPARAEASDVSC
jgi:LCP family protein required for cell wall assembly